MRIANLALIVSGVAAASALVPARASVAPSAVPQISEPAIQPVWYDRWGRWHPPHYGYGPPGYYPYGPPRYYYPYAYAPRPYYRPPPYYLYGVPPPY